MRGWWEGDDPSMGKLQIRPQSPRLSVCAFVEKSPATGFLPSCSDCGHQLSLGEREHHPPRDAVSVTITCCVPHGQLSALLCP